MTTCPRRFVRHGLALALSAAIGAATAIAAQEVSLVKPISQYSIGDVFPRAVSEAFAETGRSWKASAGELNQDAGIRRKAIADATAAKASELQAAKRELSEAKKDKDLVRIGTLQGTVKNDELLLDILKQVSDLSAEQIAVAQAWSRAGDAMERYTAADTAFDPFRTRRITRPETGEPDQRLGPDGVQAFRAHAAAMKEVGEAFSDLGNRTRTLAKERLDLLNTLSKGGHLQSVAR